MASSNSRSSTVIRDATIATSDCRLVRSDEGVPPSVVFRAHGMPRLSPEWSAIVGDILTNLRAALDHLAWQLLILDGQEPGRSTSFPFALDPANAIIKPRDWKKGDPGLRRRDLREEVERLQPYELAGQDGLLWWINELCNTDKHRELLIVGLFPDLNQVWWGGESKVRTYVNQPRGRRMGAEVRLRGSRPAQRLQAQRRRHDRRPR